MARFRKRLLALVPWCLGFSACGAHSTHPSTTEVAAIAGAQSPLARVASEPIAARTAESVKLRWEAVAGGFARAVALTTALGRVVYSSERATSVFELRTGKLLGSLETCEDVVRSSLYFHDSKLWVVCRGGVEAFSVTESKKVTELVVNEAPITATAFAGTRLALAHRDGVVRIHDLQSREIIEVVVPGPPIDVKSLALDAAAQRLAVAWVQGSIWWWELQAPSVFHKLVRNDSESDSLAFSPDGTLAEEGRSGFTTLWSLGAAGDPQKRSEIANGAWVKKFLFTRDSSWLVRGGSDGLDLAEVNGSRRLVLDTAGQVEDVAMDESGSVIASGDRAGRLMVFAPR